MKDRGSGCSSLNAQIQFSLILPQKCTQMYLLFSISTATSIMQAMGVSSELNFLNRLYHPSFFKHCDVFYLFRIKHKFLYTASKVLYVLASACFSDLIVSCSLHSLYLRHHHFLLFLRHGKLIPTVEPRS